MADKIRLGFVGANVNSTWASQSHYPALLASPDVEFTAVCTSRPKSAEEAKQKFGAKLAFHDYNEMCASQDIDAVAVVVRVPLHYGPTKAAIEAGKHVLTEWPLGKTTAEAEELAALANAKGVQTVVGLQSRVSPALMYIKELVEDGYVGEVLSCHVTTMRDGALERPSSRNWNLDITQGANTLTIANGHVIDALRFVLGDFKRVACMVTTQLQQIFETDTQKYVEPTSPDNVRVSGQLERGAAATVAVGAVPWAGTGYRMEIYGTAGTIVTTGSVSSQRGEMLRVQGAKGTQTLEDLTIPDKFVCVPADFPKGDPFNVGQLYTQFAESIRTGKSGAPTFDEAVRLHKFIDVIKKASDTGQEQAVV
ncbi:MAG TPA: oxidoreductase [Dehalococcoidia bacterium]|nr:Gfo/Idh/MocA family oxidoreductase [SAR202 cluster bacterium]HAA95980.1 oxidoreductase [Dehalococcoidia bacterium]HCL24998.1 oxidoreductase [Dehalococcoidia bacterium]|tara:strand:- start:8199 stop:9296 length:1098 start_codon:yes stop_codon:yes gene_type:complete